MFFYFEKMQKVTFGISIGICSLERFDFNYFNLRSVLSLFFDLSPFRIIGGR
jgi:hypothetical protein